MQKTLITAWFVLSAFALWAQDTTRLSLEGLMRQVEETYPDVVKFQDREQAYEARAEGAKAWMPPTFSAGVNRFPYSFGRLNEQGPMNQAGLMFSLNQMIPNPSKTDARSNYYRSLTDVERQNAEWTRNELRLIAKRLYYQRYVSEQKLQVIEENVSVLTLVISTAESRYAYNQSLLTDIYKAKAKLEEVQNMRLMEESMIAESNIGINTLLNRDIHTAFSIDTAVTLRPPAPGLQPGNIERSDIAGMQNMIRSMERQQEYMSSQAKPDFGVEVQHMQMFGMQEQFSVMGMITIPIVPWSSKMYRSDVRAMQFEIRSAQKEVESMQLMATRMAAEKQAMLQYAAEQVNNYREDIIPAFERNLEANMLAFRQNTGSFFVLLDAWEMMLMKHMELLELTKRALQLQAEYEYEMEIR